MPGCALQAIQPAADTYALSSFGSDADSWYGDDAGEAASEIVGLSCIYPGRAATQVRAAAPVYPCVKMLLDYLVW